MLTGNNKLGLINLTSAAHS